MEHLTGVTIIGLASGIIGTGTGGLMAFFITRISNRFLGFILEFSAGLMTAVICFELIPEAFEYGGIPLTFTGIVAGIVAIIAIDSIVRKSEFASARSGKNNLLKAGILMSIGIAIHNFPEGLAVGSGFEASFKLGITLAAVIAVHDIPEGVAMAVPLRVGGLSKVKAFVITVLSGIPMGFGALFGAVLGGVSREFISVCLGFAGGAMLYIVFGELVPESKRLYSGRLPSVGNVLGILCGIIITAID